MCYCRRGARALGHCWGGQADEGVGNRRIEAAERTVRVFASTSKIIADVELQGAPKETHAGTDR